LFVLVAVHIMVGLALVVAGRRVGRGVFMAAALVPSAALVWAVARAGSVLDGSVPREVVSWVPELDAALALRLDGFALVMTLVVSAVAALVLVYAWSYFDHGGPASLSRLAGLLLVFTGAMLGLVWASNLVTLFVAWELTSISSYLLIGWDDAKAAARSSALQALLTTGAGGLAMLGGFVLIAREAGSSELADLVARPPTGTAATVGMVLVLLGAFTKSAQFPFSAWLSGAMVAPTPVSALLHSATMVKAGVYLIARLAPAFAEQAAWRPIVLSVGVVTMLTGGVRALKEVDLKGILAGGTVSQLGFMVVAFGAGTPASIEAGVVLLVAHAAFKAVLFMVVGMIDHLAHTRDIRALGAFAPGWSWPRALFVVSALSMAGLPLLFGFVGKEAAFASIADAGFAGAPFVLAGIVAGSVLTVAYTARLVLGAFTQRDVAVVGGLADAPAPVSTTPAPAPAFWMVLVPLVAVTVVLGIAPGVVSRLVTVATSSILGVEHHGHLSLWHGWTLPLLLTGVVLGLGALAAARDRVVARVLDVTSTPISGQAAYQGLLRGLNRLADRVTSVVQPGSLPVYLGVTLVVLAAVPAWSLLRVPFPDLPPLTTGPGDWAAAGLIVAGGVAATIVQERISAVLCLGAVGFGMALVFVLQGAPDLALTQVCIDTLGAVVFVLVLRRLPNRFSDRATPAGRGVRIAISALVGVVVFVFIVVAVGVRSVPSVSEQFVDRSLDDGGGRNVVNVVIVDFRGFDTMGEITVLSIAGLGVYGLVRLARRESHELRTFSPLRPSRWGRRSSTGEEADR